MPFTVNTGLNDAQSHNESARSTHIYKDLNLFFTKHPLTADVSKVTDVQAIKRSVRNLVLTNTGERLLKKKIWSHDNGYIIQKIKTLRVIFSINRARVSQQLDSRLLSETCLGFNFCLFEKSPIHTMRPFLEFYLTCRFSPQL